MRLQPLSRLRTVWTRLRLRLRGDEAGARFFVHGGLPRIAGRGRIVIGEQVNWSCKGARVAVEVGPGALLEIGARSFLNAGVEIVCHRLVRIGEHCRIGPRCVLLDTNLHPVHESEYMRVAPVSLGRNVWLGREVIVLPGVTIGDHAVIAAGSVVCSDVPAREMWRGNPAAYVKPVRASEGYVRP